MRLVLSRFTAMTSLYELLQVHQPSEHLIHYHVARLAARTTTASWTAASQTSTTTSWTTTTATKLPADTAFIEEELLDDRAKFYQFLMNRVHEQAELLLHLFFIVRLTDDLPGLAMAQLEELLDFLHFLDALPLHHVRSRLWSQTLLIPDRAAALQELLLLTRVR